MPSRVLVTGATGFLGQHLTRRLLAEGLEVYMGGRNFSELQDLLSAGAKPMPFDLRDHEATVTACKRMDAVCHCGALSSPWGRRADFIAINVGGTQSLLAGCQKYSVGRFVHISSPSVLFDGTHQHEVQEDHPYPRRFLSAYAYSKKLAEDAVNETKGLATIILRPKAIFGPADNALLPRLVAAARVGRLPRIGNGQNRVDLTYVDNVVDSIWCALERPTLGGTYLITNDEHVLLWEVIARVLTQLDINFALRPMPAGLAMGLARLIEWQAIFTGKEPLLTRYSTALLFCNQTYNISAAKTKLGYQPRVSVSQGIERTLASLSQA